MSAAPSVRGWVARDSRRCTSGYFLQAASRQKSDFSDILFFVWISHLTWQPIRCTLHISNNTRILFLKGCVYPRVAAESNKIMSTRKSLGFVFSIMSLATILAAQTTRRPLKLDDLFRIKNVGDPQISPDGMWVAYVVSSTDVKADRSSPDIRMVSYDGTVGRPVTF